MVDDCWGAHARSEHGRIRRGGKLACKDTSTGGFRWRKNTCNSMGQARVSMLGLRRVASTCAVVLCVVVLFYALASMVSFGHTIDIA